MRIYKTTNIEIYVLLLVSLCKLEGISMIFFHDKLTREINRYG